MSLNAIQLWTVKRWMDNKGFVHHSFNSIYGTEAFILSTATHHIFIHLGDSFMLWCDNGVVELRYDLTNVSDLFDKFDYIGTVEHSMDELKEHRNQQTMDLFNAVDPDNGNEFEDDED